MTMCIVFATSDQKFDVADSQRLIEAALPVSKHPEIPTEEFERSFSKPRSSKGRFWKPQGGGSFKAKGRVPFKNPRHFNPRKKS